jgi:hypothetical protein
LQRFLGSGLVGWHSYALAGIGMPLLFFLDFASTKALTASE